MVPISTHRLAPLAAMLLCAGCGEQPVPWTPTAILREVEPQLRQFDGLRETLTEAHILMWRVEEDPERKLIVQEVLVWARIGPDRQRQQWALIHAYRHPSTDNGWHRSVSYSEPVPGSLEPHTRIGYQRFTGTPTANGVCGFIRYVRGPSPVAGLKHASGGFPDAAWRKITGQASPCSFSGVERG